MKLFVPDLAVSETDGFRPDLDIFNRAELGSSLTNLITRVSDPLVIALDAEWGAGKTTFLKMWAGEIRKSGHYVVYFDAFANDYLEDGFIALAAEIIGLAKQREIEGSNSAKNLRLKALGVGKLLLRGSARIAIRAATLGAIDASDAGDIVQAVSDDVADEAASAVDEYLADVLGAAETKKATIDAFRDALARLPALLQHREGESHSDESRLVVIIDELDRCRPSFALNLLERVKHVFSVPNVHFVLGVHLGQLGNSVRATYGPDTNSRLYLQKFVHLIVPLVDTSENLSGSLAKIYIDHLFKAHDFPKESANVVRDIGEFLLQEAVASEMSFRTLERIYFNMALAFASSKSSSLMISPIIGGLAVLKVLHPDLYARAKRGTLRYMDVYEPLGFGRGDLGEREDDFRKWCSDWWRFATDPDADEAIVLQMSRGLRLRERLRLVPIIANSMMDQFVPAGR